MKTLQIDEKNARALYKGASKEFKATLEDTFGKEFFSGKITDRIKSFEDACAELFIEPEEVLIDLQGNPSADEVAYRKLKVITAALNEGWLPDWKDSSEYKYYPWFEYSRSASSFVYSNTNYTNTNTNISSQLCGKTKRAETLPLGKR